MTEKLNGAITLKQAGLLTGIMCALVTLVATAQAAFILPAFRAAAKDDAASLIDKHAALPHPAAVTRNEFQLLLNRLDRITVRLERLSEQLKSK